MFHGIMSRNKGIVSRNKERLKTIKVSHQTNFLFVDSLFEFMFMFVNTI